MDIWLYQCAETSRHSDRIVQRANSQALASALGQILDHPDLAEELGKHAYERAKSHFSLSAIGQQLRSCLDI